MSLATVISRSIQGIQVPEVMVEVHLSNGLPSLNIVGMAETAVKESKDRVRSAIVNSHFNFPQQRITINLAPADLPKEGGRFDLPIALGILAASAQIPQQALEHTEFIGELSLSGQLRAVRGVLPTILMAAKSKHSIILPDANQDEAALVEHATCYGADSLLAVCRHLHGETSLQQVAKQISSINNPYPDLADVQGQSHAKRAIEIAASGGHSLLLSGPPGTGKTMLASRLPGIMPEMTEQEAVNTATVYSISTRGFDASHWKQRPFRSPHHTASAVALVGGGSPPKPGEISLANNGILFLDELPEFDRKVLEVLREPIESGKITISRASHQAEFPAQFQLVAAMNPCPCGYLGQARCRCTEDQVRRYKAKVSGPLMDRIDMLIEVPAVTQSMLSQPTQQEPSSIVKQRVVKARELQLNRANKANFALAPDEINQYCQLASQDQTLLEQAMNKLQLSARSYHRILKVARTIADMGNCQQINSSHLTEAISYRRLDHDWGN